jgi:SAM-dependent methyltransferase
MAVSRVNKNTKETWEAYFKDGWERNNGRQQTRLFCRFFLETVPLPASARSLLDVGCGMGDALPEFKERYPHLQLTGCDVSTYAIEKARESYGDLAQFETWSFEQISGHFDIIYCSNTLEHFDNYLDIARQLLARCDWLYVLVPYLQFKEGKPIKPGPGQWHMATFSKGSFDPLRSSGCAKKIKSWIRYTPGAWGNGPVPWRTRLQFILKGQPLPDRQIFYEVVSCGKSC